MKTLRWAVALAAAAALAVSATPAHADGEPRPEKDGPRQSLDYTPDPLNNPDALVTDDMEALVPPGGDTGGCTNESVLTGPPAVPAAPSFQLLYVVPSDVTATTALDVPRSCNDGTVVPSAIGRASRNLATWQYRRQAGLNYRTMTATYTHNFTDAQYSTRSVRRFRSQYTRAQWEAQPIKVTGSQGSPRYDLLAQELSANGYDLVAGVRYTAVLHANAQPFPGSTSCGYTVGVAATPGRFGLVTRMLPRCTTTTGGVVPAQTIRYGCASTSGDAFLAHEQSHQVGANHVGDYAYDLMVPSKPGANFTTSPYLQWDYNRDDYHATVSGSVYVVGSGLSGSYYTC